MTKEVVSIKVRDVVEDVTYGRVYAVTKVNGDLLDLRDVGTKTEYTNVPVTDVVLVPGLRERL